MKRNLMMMVILGIILFSVIVHAQLYIKRDVGKLQVGMTTDEVRNLFGRPHHINTYSEPRGEIQQWVYKESRFSSLYVYFLDGAYFTYERFDTKR